MKRLLTIFIVLALSHPQQSFAAPKPVAVKEVALLATDANAEGVLALGNQVITFANQSNATADISITSRDTSGLTVWTKVIDSGRDEIASAIAADGKGAVWLAGVSAAASTPDTTTVVGTVSNPDGVSTEKPQVMRKDLTELSLWQLSPAGELLSTYTTTLGTAGLVTAVSVSTSGVSVVGSKTGGVFVVSASTTGVFSKVISFGTSKTTINSIARASDGGHYLTGSSAETLGGKKPVGARDGVLIKVSKTGALSKVVRSSASGASRSWNCSTANLFSVGDVKSSKSSEVAITKFTTSFTPTWTMRLPSSGANACSIGAAGSFHAAFTQSSALKGFSGVKASKGQGVILAIDSKGVITGAVSNSAMGQPLALSYSPGNGVALLASGIGANPSSIFYLKTR